MDKTTHSKIINGSGGTADRTSPAAPDKGGRAFGKRQGKQNPRETAQEAVHQVMPKDAADSLAPAADAANPPLRAAKGDDDLMSQPVKRS